MAERTANIGVTCNLEVVKYGIWTEPAAMVPLTYVRATYGGEPPAPHLRPAKRTIVIKNA